MKRWVGALAVAISACGGGGTDDSDRPDASASDDGGPALDAAPDYRFDVTDPVEPLPASPPMFTPCRFGWAEVGGLCEPWPETGRENCPPDQAHYPGHAGCELIGAPCTSDQYASDLPPGASFVSATSTAVGPPDGTRAHPYTQISEALAAGAIAIALSKGVFHEEVEISSPHDLRGACVAETHLVGDITIRGVDATIENLTIEAADHGIAAVMGGAAAAHDLVIVGGTTAGVLVEENGQAMLHKLVSRDAEGRGIRVRTGGTAHAENVVVSGAREVGISAADAQTRLTVDNASVYGLRGDTRGEYGYGFGALNGATFIAHGVVIEDSHEGGGGAYDPSTTLTIEDSVLRRATGTDRGQYGVGLIASLGATVELRRVRIEDHRLQGISTSSAAHVLLEDVLVARTAAQSIDGREGEGLVARMSSVQGTRVRLEGNRTYGLTANGGATCAFEDLTITGTEPRSDGLLGDALSILDGSHVSARKAELFDNTGSGLLIHGSGSHAQVSDLTIRGHSGRALDLDEGATATVASARIEGNQEASIVTHDPETRLELIDVRVAGGGRGIVVQSGSIVIAHGLIVDRANQGAINADGNGTRLELEEAIVRDTEGDAQGIFGRALDATRGASILGSHVILENARECALLVSQPGSRVEIAGLIIDHTRERACAATSCTDSPGGLGAHVESGGVLLLRGFRVTDNALFGIQVGADGEVDLADGVISGNLIGINVVPQGYDESRLTEGVRFESTPAISSSEAFLPSPLLPEI